MSVTNASEHWIKKTHSIPAAHPRGYARAVRDPQKSRLKLYVSQYIPQKAPSDPDAQAITLILQHGMPPGDNAACLEPFLSDLLNMTKLPVRSIWAMDFVNCGRSFQLNRNELGDEVDGFDGARDITQMVSHFRDEMQPPIIGFAQSYGAVPVLVAAAWNPGLFWGVVGSDVVVGNGYTQWVERGKEQGDDMKVGMARGLFKRQRVWKSRENVRQWFTEGAGKRIGRQYDQRVLSKIIENDYEETGDGNVKMITPPSQTVAYFGRPDPPVDGMRENIAYRGRTEEMCVPTGFWCPWVVKAREYMGGVTCRVLYLWGTSSEIATPQYRRSVADNTGTGMGGGGGTATGQVTETDVEGGHSLPLFVPMKTAEAVALWLTRMWQEWLEDQEAASKEPPIHPESLPPEFAQQLAGKPSKL